MDEHMSNNHFDHDSEGNDQSHSENEMEWNEENIQNVNSSSQPPFNEVQILYHASKIIRNNIDKPALDIPWPLLAADITDENVKKVVDPILFNFLAWICGFSEDPQLDSYVSVKDTHYSKLMSLSQDLLFIASDGKKVTPKSISLAMALRQLTGSSSVLKLVNNFGHCMSHRYVLHHDTALAQVNISSRGTLPPGFSKNRPTTLAWDNDDFCEETKTGKGTTHITGGIIIQRHCSEAEETEALRNGENIVFHCFRGATTDDMKSYI